MSTTAERIVAYARAQLGDPYGWGATGPDSFDCSGLVYAAYKAAGLKVSRTTAAALGKQGTAVSAAAALPGDLVYFDEPGATDHVGIYIGGGQMIEAPTQGVPVRVASVAGRRPTSYRRMPGVQDGAAAFAGAGGSAKADGDSTVFSQIPGLSDVGGAVGDAVGAVGGAAASALDVLNVFDGWKGSLIEVGMKMTAAAAAAALVIVGAKTALSSN